MPEPMGMKHSEHDGRKRNVGTMIFTTGRMSFPVVESVERVRDDIAWKRASSTSTLQFTLEDGRPLYVVPSSITSFHPLKD